jgi:hypothetical protein
MNKLHLIVVGALAVVSGSPAMAQHVKGNEAVQTTSAGAKRVETPPTTGALLAKPCPASDAACTAAGWKMVETADGLQECTEFYARPGTCRPSTYGTEKRTRLWVVKKDGQWLQCQYPNLSSKCGSLKSLPYPALQ